MSTLRCVAPGAQDETPPALLEAAVVAPAMTNATPVIITFRASERLSPPPDVTLTLGDDVRRAELVDTDDAAQPSYRYRYQPQQDEREGVAELGATLTDRIGNVVTVSLNATITFDRTPPAIVAGSESIGFVGNNSEAAAGSRIEARFTATEPLGADPTGRSTLDPALVLSTVSNTGESYVIAGVVPAGLAEGAHVIAATLSDRAGNTVDIPLAFTNTTNGLIVDTTPPPPPAVDVPGMVTLTRYPFGSDSTAGATRVTLSAAPGAIEPGARVRAFSEQLLADGFVLGEAVADDTGALAPTRLIGSDLERVYVIAVDNAGNTSALAGQAALVRDVELVASIQSTSATQPRVTRLEERGTWLPRFRQAAITVDDASALSRRDDVSVTTRGGAHWQQHKPMTVKPQVMDGAMTYDPRTSSIVLSSGSNGCAGIRTVWRRSQGVWEEVAVTDPEVDGEPLPTAGISLTTHTDAGQIIRFGGADRSTWNWTGESWRRLCSDCGPPQRTQHAVAYDPERAVIVVFGGIQGATLRGDTWEWNGSSWRERCTDATCQASRPPALNGARMTYDPQTREVLMFGGRTTSTNVDTTWTWNGTRWQQRCTGGCVRPSARSLHVMTTQTRTGKPLVIGGGTLTDGTCTALPIDVWQWNGEAWASVATSNAPPQRTGAAAAYDPERDVVVLQSGAQPVCSVSGCLPRWTDTWELRDSVWTRSDNQVEIAEVNRQFVYDRGRQRVVGSGTTFTPSTATQLYTWEGYGWVASGSPSAVGFPSAFASNPSSGFMALTSDGTYTVAGNTWTARCGAGCTEPDYNGAAIISASFGALYVDSNVHKAWNSATLTWSDIAVPSALAINRYPTLVRSSGASAVAFGGDTSGQTDNTFVWNGSSWTAVSPETRPTARTAARGFFDAIRERSIILGGVAYGQSVPGGVNPPVFRDAWEWDGTTWRELNTAAAYPEGAPASWGMDIVYDEPRRSGLAWFNATVAGQRSETWSFHGGADFRPAHVIAFSASAAAIARSDAISDVRVEWRGSARGFNVSTPVDGAALWIWDFDRWRQVTTVTASGATSLAWSSAADGELARALARLIAGEDRTILFAVTPLADNGRGNASEAYGFVSTDYADVTVRYRYP